MDTLDTKVKCHIHSQRKSAEVVFNGSCYHKNLNACIIRNLSQKLCKIHCGNWFMTSYFKFVRTYACNFPCVNGKRRQLHWVTDKFLVKQFFLWSMLFTINWKVYALFDRLSVILDMTLQLINFFYKKVYNVDTLID